MEAKTLLSYLFVGAGSALITFLIIRTTPKPDSNEICTDYSKDNKSKLTSGLVYDMVHKYRNNQLKNIQDPNTGQPISEDAYAIWFDLDTIKKFIYHFEHDMKNDATYSNNKRGLRIYYAAYPDSTTWNKKEYKNALSDMLKDPMKRKYEKKHTLVMIPTLQTKDGKIIDVNLFDKSTFANGISKKEYADQNGGMKPVFRPKPIYSLLPVSKSAVSTSTTSDDIAARNHGGLYPPNSITELGF